MRRANAAWLEEWDATSPDPDAPSRTFDQLVEQYDRDARAGRALPFAVEVEGRFVGQLSVGSIVLGSFRSCYIGYWVSRSVAGQMVIPTALALAGDHALGVLGLHRLEVNIRPENTASLAVVRKLGFRREGLRPHYLHIAGAWRDHLSFALTTEDLAGETLTERLEPDRRAGGRTALDDPSGTVVTTVTCATHRWGSGARRRRAPTVITVQSPSSLIFLVLLGVWAAYFVQYWVRRRDHVATARSVEQFSEAMRVLERRDPLPRTDFSEPAPRSYTVHPARAARPQVLVKRAVAAEPGTIGVTQRITEAPDAVAPAAAPATPAGPATTSAPAAPAAHVPPRPRVRPSRRVRGLLFLAAVAELLVIVPLVAFGVLPLWTLVPAVLAVGCALLFVRSGARTERALVRAQRRRQAGLERLRASAPVVSRPGRRVTGRRRLGRRRGRDRPPAWPSSAPAVSEATAALRGPPSPSPTGRSSTRSPPLPSPPPTSWCRSSTTTTSRSPGTPCPSRARPTR